MIHSRPDREGFKTEERLEMSTVASDAVILPTPCTTLRDITTSSTRAGSNLALAKRSSALLPRFSILPTKLLVLDWSQLRQAARIPPSLARSTICFPAFGAFIGETCATGYYTRNFGSCMHVWCSKPYRRYGTCTIKKLFGSQQLEH